jgi:hypothetical protein
MPNFKVRSKSLAEARAFFNKAGNRVWQIKTKTNKISPHLTITFSSNLTLTDLKSIIAEYSNDGMMVKTLQQDSREIHLV